MCLEKGSGVSVVCRGGWLSGWIFWEVMHLIMLMNFRSGNNILETARSQSGVV